MSKREYVFGANILENLTTGMYQDSKVIYREYIQNSCDQIDKAIELGFLNEGEGKIEIWLDEKKRTIVIEDNATGIPEHEFKKKLGDIADSDKKIGIDKGFRGIGRLCGLAYCKELVFTSKAKGENVISIMRCNAEKMRELIFENANGKKHTATDILININNFETKNAEDIESHFFKVELIGVNNENTDLLDKQEIINYLSFIAPVPYQTSFLFRKQIKEHASNLDFKLDEYIIKMDGTQILKRYTKTLKKADNTELDQIFDVEFHDFYDEKGNLLAWSWVGLTQCKQQIPKINQTRGIRLRKENIQIGGEDTLQKLFKEDRGNGYFVGEVFAVSKMLIPNSQRDYFNENHARATFEKRLREYFNELYKVYRMGSTISSSLKKINNASNLKEEFIQMDRDGKFVNKDHRNKKLEDVQSAQKEADSAHKKIQNEKVKATSIGAKVLDQITSQTSIHSNQNINPEDLSNDEKNEIEFINLQEKILHRADKFVFYSQKERDLISKIFDIILKSTDEETAETIICNIEDGLS